MACFFKEMKSIFFALFRLSKKIKPASVKNQLNETEDLYSLNGHQLKNLLEKNISFQFFSLSEAPEDTGLNKVFQKAQLKSEKEILDCLKNQDLKQPVILVCEEGALSQAFSKQLREKGFVNCYFLKKGFQSIKEFF